MNDRNALGTCTTNDKDFFQVRHSGGYFDNVVDKANKILRCSFWTTLSLLLCSYMKLHWLINVCVTIVDRPTMQI